MAIEAVSSATYADWYLSNLTNTAKVQETKMGMTSADAVKSQAANTQNSAPKQDTVSFSESARQALDARNAAKKDENIADKLAKISQSNSPREEAIAEKTVSDEEKPDYRAIALIKNSAIEIPAEVSDGNAQSNEAIAAEIAQPSGENQVSGGNYSKNNIVENGLQAQQPAAERSESVSEASRDFTARRRENRQSAQSVGEKPEQVQKRAEENDSATNSTAEEIASENKSRVTPAQAKGIESYQRAQLYSNSLNLSLANSIA